MATSLSSASITQNPHAGNPTRRPVPVGNVGTIGQPHTFASGPLAPRTIRIELEELQNPDRGRKYAHKDKRPLDPPPVVLCRFFELLSGHDGRRIEVEMDPSQPSLGAICHLDLFPVPPRFYNEADHQLNQTSTHPWQRLPADQVSESHVHSQAPVLQTVYGGAEGTEATLQTVTAPPPPTVASLHWHGSTTPNDYTSQAVTSSTSATLPSGSHTLLPYPGYPSVPHGAHVPPDPAAGPQWQEAAISSRESLEQDIVANYPDFPIRESSKCSNMLSGTTFAHAEVVDIEEKKSAVFVFPDVSVKAEGTFVLRYRMFNTLSKVDNPPSIPALAECYGGPFKIYSSKEFPGLQASTELTKVRPWLP
ncbi:hypothetical protein FKP32DRAFT_1470746 [Trametes sanguinea]|nr:hypothetical protein FKP32DRAFT_1470746 [Trametes sanguinea]